MGCCGGGQSGNNHNAKEWGNDSKKYGQNENLTIKFIIGGLLVLGLMFYYFAKYT